MYNYKFPGGQTMAQLPSKQVWQTPTDLQLFGSSDGDDDNNCNKENGAVIGLSVALAVLFTVFIVVLISYANELKKNRSSNLIKNDASLNPI